jgi:hypothetical protein
MWKQLFQVFLVGLRRIGYVEHQARWMHWGGDGPGTPKNKGEIRGHRALGNMLDTIALSLRRRCFAAAKQAANACPNLRVKPDGLQCSDLRSVIPGSPESGPDASTRMSPVSTSQGRCPQSGRWVGIKEPGDGDGCAGE